MKIKKFLLALTMLCSIAAFAGNATTIDHGNNKATVKERVANMTKEQKEVRIAEIKVRINEIKAMDISKLNRDERKALRQELRSMNKEAHYLGDRDVVIVLMGGFLFSLLLLLAVY